MLVGRQVARSTYRSLKLSLLTNIASEAAVSRQVLCLRASSLEFRSLSFSFAKPRPFVGRQRRERRKQAWFTCRVTSVSSRVASSLKKKKLRSRRLLFRRYANNSATSQGNRYQVSRESINLTRDACSSDPKSSIRSEQFGAPIGPVLVRRSGSGASVVEFIDSAFPDAQNKRRSPALYALEELLTVGTGLVGRRLNGLAGNETGDESEKNVFIFSASFQ